MPAGSVRFSVCPEVHPVYCIRAGNVLVYYISYLEILYVHGIFIVYSCSTYLAIYGTYMYLHYLSPYSFIRTCNDIICIYRFGWPRGFVKAPRS